MGKYKMRAECISDICKLLENFPTFSTPFKKMKIEFVKGFPDAVCTFKTDNIESILTVLKSQDDSHVMLETLQPYHNYTGIREVVK